LVLQGEEKEGGAVGRLNLQGRVASISQGISWERYSTDGASVSSLTAIMREQAKCCFTREAEAEKLLCEKVGDYFRFCYPVRKTTE
jgi:hypothetical protein